MSERQHLEQQLAEELGFEVKWYENLQRHLIKRPNTPPEANVQFATANDVKFWEFCLSLLEREAKAREIFRELAKLHPWHEGGWCRFGCWSEEGTKHADSCPYRRAVELLEQDRETKR